MFEVIPFILKLSLNVRDSRFCQYEVFVACDNAACCYGQVGYQHCRMNVCCWNCRKFVTMIWSLRFHFCPDTGSCRFLQTDDTYIPIIWCHVPEDFNLLRNFSWWSRSLQTLSSCITRLVNVAESWEYAIQVDKGVLEVNVYLCVGVRLEVRQH